MLLAQDGFQASTRISDGIADGAIDGAVVSSLFRKPDTLKACIEGLSEGDRLVLFDNEFYINAVMGADKFGKFAEYPYYGHPVTKKDLTSPFKLTKYIKDVIDFQIDVVETRVLTTPTVIIESFDHASEVNSLALLSGSSEYVASERSGDVDALYGSIVINEQALANTDSLPEFLDSLTGYDNLKGYYLVIDKTTSGFAYWSNPATLAVVMYVASTLKKNGYDVIIGYADVPDLLALATGAKAVATGWWQNTTNFSQRKFKESGGGRRRVKYFSPQLMSNINIDPELQLAKTQGLVESVTAGNDVDRALAADPYDTPWSDSVAIGHKWQSIKTIVDEINAATTEEEKLAAVESRLDKALETYGQLIDAGIKFEQDTGPRKVHLMKQAISLYRDGVLY